MITAAIVIELALKSLLVAGGALAALRLVRKRSAAQRSWIAHLGLVALVLLPAAVLLMPGWNPLPAKMSANGLDSEFSSSLAVFPSLAAAEIEQAGAAAEAAVPPGNAAEAPSFVLPTAGELAVWAYATPAVLLLLTMLVAVVRLGAMHRRAHVLVDSSWLSALAQAQRRMGFKHGTALLVSPELRSPVSWGLMRPIILLNEQTVGARGQAEAIIAHELAHVARLDWAKLLIARVACALFWFNPLVWRLAREAHQLREEAADDAVLLSEVDDAAYATLLVNAARHDNPALLIAAHGVAPAKDSLKRRITRVLDRDQARGPASNAWSLLCVASLLAVAMPLAAYDPAVRAVLPEPAELVASGAATANGTSVAADLVDPALPAAAGLPETGALPAVPATAVAHHSSAEDDEIDTLVAWKAVGMTPEYAAQIRAAGFPRASIDDLMGAKAVGVTPDFAREVRSWDSRATLEDVVGARAVGLSPAYIGEMRAIFPSLELEDAVGMRALGVTAEYAREMRALFPRVTGEEVTEMKAVGVTPAFVREMRKQGIDANDPEEAVEGRLFSSKGQGIHSHVAASMAEAGAAIGAAVAQGVTSSLAVPAPRPAPNPRPSIGPGPPGTPD